MDRLDAVLTWLSTLPQGALLSSMALLAAVENIFPPIPADVLVGFGGFLAARAKQSPLPAFFSVWLGSVAGAALMYRLGSLLGTRRIEARHRLDPTGTADQRVREWYARFGTLAIFLSRFVPGVRAVVPPLAGSLRLKPLPVLTAIAAASGLWYGAITWLAFRAGNNWDALKASLGNLGWGSAALGGLGLLVIVLVWWYTRRGRS